MIFLLIAHQLGHTIFQQAPIETVPAVRRDPYRHPTRWRGGKTVYIRRLAWNFSLLR